MLHHMKLQKNPFNKVKSGEKIIESRLYDEKRRQINIGDQIEFTCNDEPTKKILIIVKALYRYGSFNELFSDFPPEYFGGESKRDMVEEIKIFYSKKEQKDYGIIGIKMQLAK